MNRFKVPEGHCINCHHHLNGAKGLHQHVAKPGDITVCVYCGMLMQFGPNMEYLEVPDKILVEVRKSALWGEVVEIQKRLSRLL